MGSHGSPSMTGCSGDPSDSRSCRISTFLVSIQGRTSAWLLYACFPALLWTSSAPAACCQLRTTCALPGTEGRVVQIMVSTALVLECVGGQGFGGAFSSNSLYLSSLYASLRASYTPL